MLRVNLITSVDCQDGVEVNVTRNQDALIRFDSLCLAHTQSACFSRPAKRSIIE